MPARKDIFNGPLSLEEQEFAEKNHHLVGTYLGIRKLPFDEWYDVVIFRYLRSVKRWFAIPALHEHSFKTVAFYAMRSAISNELKKQGRRVQAVSLDEEIPGTGGITYADTVTYRNMDYLKGNRNMDIRYDVQLPERKEFNGGRKSRETLAVEGFLISRAGNMCLEYGTEEEARKKCASMQGYRRDKKFQGLYDVWRSGNCVYVVKAQGEGQAALREKAPQPGRVKKPNYKQEREETNGKHKDQQA